MSSKAARERARKLQHYEFTEIVNEAHRAGMAAVYDIVAFWIGEDPETACVDPFRNEPFPKEGCGSAWVSVNGNTRFGRWAMKQLGWRRVQGLTGVSIGVNLFGQCENRSHIYACAYAASLTKAGVKASGNSRSD